jgi:hypothetical protein
MNENAHIYNALQTRGPIREPHYCAESYQGGENTARGFEVEGNPAEPTHQEVHVGPNVTYVATGKTLWEDREPSEGGRVVRVGNTLDFSGPAEEPDYMNPDRAREEKAEAAARAVKAAIMRGEIDADLFSD